MSDLNTVIKSNTKVLFIKVAPGSQEQETAPQRCNEVDGEAGHCDGEDNDSVLLR